jgi:hypothetical protein
MQELLPVYKQCHVSTFKEKKSPWKSIQDKIIYLDDETAAGTGYFNSAKRIF